jgi:sporulation protein YabP
MSDNTRISPKNTTQNETSKVEHGFVVRERAHVEIRGMTEVISFDENSVLLLTTSGTMCVEGSELKVNVLDVKEGNVTVDGHVDSIYYSDAESNDRTHGLFGRLFH